MVWTFISFVRSFYRRSLTTTGLQYLIFSFRCAQTTDRHSSATITSTERERGGEEEEGTETKFYQSSTHSTVTDERVLLNCQSHYTVLICCWLFFFSLSLSSLSLTCPTAKTSRINRFVTNHHDIHPLFLFFFCTHALSSPYSHT